MANVIGNLRAILSLNTKSFVAGLTTAGRATKQFRGSMFNLGRDIRTVGGFLGGFVAPGAAIWGMVNQFRELGDLADLSERLNIDPKALQGFRLGAMDAGLAAEDTTQALQFMLKTVGEAAAGSKEATKAVDGLGLSVKDLAASSSEEILYRIADALQNIPDASRRAAKEVDLFGRSGAKLDTALKGGRGSLKGLEEEMRKMGRSFEPEELRKVDEATDKFNRLKEAFKGLGSTIAIETAPFMTRFFDGMKEGVSALGSVFRGQGIAPPTPGLAPDPDVEKNAEFERNRRNFRMRNPGQRLPLNLMNAKERALYDQQEKFRDDAWRAKQNRFQKQDEEIDRRRSQGKSSDAGSRVFDDMLGVLRRIEAKGGMMV